MKLIESKKMKALKQQQKIEYNFNVHGKERSVTICILKMIIFLTLIQD